MKLLVPEPLTDPGLRRKRRKRSTWAMAILGLSNLAGLGTTMRHTSSAASELAQVNARLAVIEEKLSHVAPAETTELRLQRLEERLGAR